MLRFISTIVQTAQARSRARRRAANFRAGGTDRTLAQLLPTRTAWRPRSPRLLRWHWLLMAGVMLAGAALIVVHARFLAGGSGVTVQSARAERAVQAFQGVLPGVRFEVPEQAGITTSLQPEAALLVLAGMQAAPPVRIDLCSQLRAPDDARLLPLRIGYRFEDVQRWVGQNEESKAPQALRNVLLVSQQGDMDGMPLVQITGKAVRAFSDPASEPLQLSWQSKTSDVRWLSDASLGQIEQGSAATVGLRQLGWLVWGKRAALRIERRNNIICPQAGELSLQLYRVAHRDLDGKAGVSTPAPAALVQAFPARGRPVSSLLMAGVYQVPASPAAALEDASLFASLQAQGLLRLNSQGSIELAPPDLLQWQELGTAQRVDGPAAWQDVAHDAATRKLLKRLYYQADGAYVRQQIDLFNSERWLLAWRVPKVAQAGAVAATVDRRHTDAPAQWQAGMVAKDDGVSVPLATTAQMPVAASRLFDALPQGWQSWNRLAHWPQSLQAQQRKVRLQFAVPPAAQGSTPLRLMLIGRVLQVSGASVRSMPACTGRACRAASDVQQLVLDLLPGARSVVLDVVPLAFQPEEDQKYRHLSLDHGILRWQALPVAAAGKASLPAQAGIPAALQLSDRHGTPLWRDGAPTADAAQAGLAPLLGLARDHGSSVAGMLARLPHGPQQARLSLDLPLQALSQQVLDCVGLRRGRWEDGQCRAAQPVPEGRHAGMVILDAENGDILAAAGAGTGLVNAANWAEVRDFDRTSPARSPLRLPAWQHDGGAHQSPGSTFKVVSALGLELAARDDSQLDALLAGQPLPALNQLARQRGFGFQTDAASYPLNPRLAHVTNYHEQSLERRAQDGKLGLAQALTYSINTWFAWTGELSDRSLFGRAEGGAPDLQALDAAALDPVRPIVAAARRLGFEQACRLDGGLLPADYDWRYWDALQATPAHIDPIHTRHELRQMSIGLRMQATPLQMALASAAIAQGRVVTPRLLLALDQRTSAAPEPAPLGIRLDRIRAGMKGVVDIGTGAGAFRQPALAGLRRGLYGKTGTAPTGPDSATVWFTGWLEAGSLPGQTHRLAVAIFVSHSDATGGEHAAPVLATVLAALVRAQAQAGSDHVPALAAVPVARLAMQATQNGEQRQN
ncbi:penicillin-binding transpeptidase domain-containing protein [Duganella qianjiadongensis]|uniref:beta-lactamase n=1 Tax=Duganella qianjiadongensis TaxID=2692176 RepID=A0ABW9VGR2_9BURK|nr:penicillin-binding transpeptidase domain-containing protein [Duganella qianjiadongensis]MYM37763.1 hypothetical protein [Duganella qianjiadongensis]